jgi:hypothetical protein
MASSQCCVLLKKDAPVDDISSYRPISLTSVVVKSMERLVLNRMMARVKDKLINTQAGFRPRHCCTDQIYQLLSAIKSYHHTNEIVTNHSMLHSSILAKHLTECGPMVY